LGYGLLARFGLLDDSWLGDSNIRQPVLLGLARLTCPIVPVSRALHFGVKWYWVSVSNVLAYALIGLMVEALLQSRNRFQAAQR
jgi:hypothetical protein